MMYLTWCILDHDHRTSVLQIKLINLNSSNGHTFKSDYTKFSLTEWARKADKPSDFKNV